MDDFQFMLDSGETISVSRHALIHVEQEVMDRVRPAKFREILKVDTSVPWWSERYSFDKVVEHAQWMPAQEFTEEFATATTRIENEEFRLHEMVSGYRYGVRELVRAQQLRRNLDAERAMAVMKKGEKVLEHIAADGTIDGTKPLGALKGVFNSANATELGTTSGTTALDGFTQSWELRFAAATTNDEHDTACEVVINDLLSIEDQSIVVTKETAPIDTIVLPLSVRTILRKTKTHTERSLENMFLDRAVGVKRLIYWNKADENDYGVDADHTRRIVGLAAADTEAARFVLPKSPTPGRAVQLMNGGVHVPVSMVTGGFNTKLPGAVIHADLDNAA